MDVIQVASAEDYELNQPAKNSRSQMNTPKKNSRRRGGDVPALDSIGATENLRASINGGVGVGRIQKRESTS